MANKSLFLDTAYVLALFNTRDQWHPKAIEWQKKIALDNSYLITTEFVLAEIGDGLSSQNLRANAVDIIRILIESPTVRVIPADSSLFMQGLRLYESRPDKDWGLTDCTSFVIMQDFDVSDALTTDGHFEQAGFNPLLIG